MTTPWIFVVTFMGLAGSKVAMSAVKFVDPAATGLNNGSSWANAYTSLQTAIGATANGDELWIRSGTYKPTSGADRTISFSVAKNFALRGGFAGTEGAASDRDILANPTILTGDLSANDSANFGNRSDNSYHVVKFTPDSHVLALDGLVIRGGNADGGTSPNGEGGGVLVVNASEDGAIRLNVLASRLEDNSAAKCGGAISGQLVGVTLRGNSLDLTHETVVAGNRCLGTGGGDAERGGGGVSVAGLIATRVRFEGNRAIDSAGGGVTLSNAAAEASSLVNVAFLDNVADGPGGGMFAESSAAYTNCLFARNEATGAFEEWGGGDFAGYGGGLATKGVAALTNCTVADNLATNEDGDGGGVAAIDFVGVLAIHNSILWGNRVDDGMSIVSDHSAQTPLHPSGSDDSSPLTYSNIENYESCIGFGCPAPVPNYHNIGDDLVLHDPIFASPGSDNYRHMSFFLYDVASDAELPDDVNDVDEDADVMETLPLDLSVRQRIIGSHVDMGAYEWCLGDLNGDGAVYSDDNGLLLAYWGECPSNAPCPGDLNGDGDVDSSDLGLLLANWACGIGEEEMLTGLGPSPLNELLVEYGFEEIAEFSEWLGTLDAEARYAVLEPIL